MIQISFKEILTVLKRTKFDSGQTTRERHQSTHESTQAGHQATREYWLFMLFRVLVVSGNLRTKNVLKTRSIPFRHRIPTSVFGEVNPRSEATPQT